MFKRQDFKRGGFYLPVVKKKFLQKNFFSKISIFSKKNFLPNKNCFQEQCTEKINKSYRQYTKSYRDLKIYSLIDKLVKMLVLKIFITGDVSPFGLASFTDEP